MTDYFKEKYVVEIIESERGWGQRIDDRLYFPSRKEAEDFVLDFNSRNPDGPAPDWYMFAILVS